MDSRSAESQIGCQCEPADPPFCLSNLRIETDSEHNRDYLSFSEVEKPNTMRRMISRRFYVQLLIPVLASIGHAKGGEKAASATENYISARNIGFDRVLADYSEELEILLADRKKAADLEGAKAATAELEWIEAIRKRAKSTELIPLPDSSERKVGLASLLRA